MIRKINVSILTSLVLLGANPISDDSNSSKVQTPLSKLKTSKEKQIEMFDDSKYEKVSLFSVVLETVSQSYNAKAAREKMEQAKIDLDSGYANYYPTLKGSYKAGRTRARPGDDDNSKKFYQEENYELTLRQNIYSGGATASEIETLKRNYTVAKNQYKLAIAKEVENAIKAYFDVLFNFESLNVNMENMKRLEEVLEIVNIKFDAGAASIGDLSSIKANVANAQSKLVKVQSSFNEALEFYKYIVGEEHLQTFPYEEDFDTSIDDMDIVIQKAIQNNRNIQNYVLKIEAEKYKFATLQSKFKPTLDFELTGTKIVDQEDHEVDEDTVKGMLTLSYNFFNGGKDKNKLLKSSSVIRQLEYKLNEEKRKLKWTLSKLHTSVVSLSEASISTKEEVAASIDMVSAYWEGFKTGEQDLQVLLQSQRQLNTAQLELIKYKKNSITDYFKILNATGGILEYFNLNIDSANFIDFTRKDYKNILKTQDHNLTTPIVKDEPKQSNMIEEKTQDDNTTKEKIDIVDSLNNLLDFKNKFYTANDQNFTVMIDGFSDTYDALDFSYENNISNDVFIFDTLVENSIQSSIAYGIYENKKIAKDSLKDLNTTNKTELKTIKEIKDLVNEFENKELNKEKLIEKVVEKIVPVMVKPKPKEPFKTNEEFKNRFLNADEEKYTINITSLASMDEAEQLVLKYDIDKESFVFNHGDENDIIKVVYGIFDNYDDAKATLATKPNLEEKYDPVIEKIKQKQDLYNSTKKVQKIQPKEVKEETIVKEDENLTENITFKEKFLGASQDKYTINLATLGSKKIVEKFKKQNAKLDDIFIFKFGANKTYYKVVKGIYDTKDDAKKAIDKLSRILKRNKPSVYNIKKVQDLYHKYNSQQQLEQNQSAQVTVEKKEQKEQREPIQLNEKKQIKEPKKNIVAPKQLKENLKKKVTQNLQPSDQLVTKKEYVIYLGNEPKQSLNYFIKRYKIDTNILVTTNKENKLALYLRGFQTQKEALQYKQTLHPELYKKSIVMSKKIVIKE